MTKTTEEIKEICIAIDKCCSLVQYEFLDPAVAIGLNKDKLIILGKLEETRKNMLDSLNDPMDAASTLNRYYSAIPYVSRFAKLSV